MPIPYMIKQTPEDLLLFLQHDSDGESPVDMTIDLGLAEPVVLDESRESIEVRLLALF